MLLINFTLGRKVISLQVNVLRRLVVYFYLA